MSGLIKELQVLMASEAFQVLLNSDIVKLNQLFAVQALLIKTDIPFDLEFSPGTRRVAEAVELTIYINPTTTVSLVINLEPGGTIFSGLFPGG